DPLATADIQIRGFWTIPLSQPAVSEPNTALGIVFRARHQRDRDYDQRQKTSSSPFRAEISIKFVHRLSPLCSCVISAPGYEQWHKDDTVKRRALLRSARGVGMFKRQRPTVIGSVGSEHALHGRHLRPKGQSTSSRVRAARNFNQLHPASRYDIPQQRKWCLIVFGALKDHHRQTGGVPDAV